MVINAEVHQANGTTLGSARRSVVKKSLTGPTLLEMSGKRVNQALALMGERGFYPYAQPVPAIKALLYCQHRSAVPLLERRYS